MDIGPGDVVMCVSAAQSTCPDGHPEGGYRPLAKVGRVYTVIEAIPPHPHWEGCCIGGVRLLELPFPTPLGSFCVGRFRKVEKADEGFATWMRSLKPRQKVREPASCDSGSDRQAETLKGAPGEASQSGARSAIAPPKYPKSHSHSGPITGEGSHDHA